MSRQTLIALTLASAGLLVVLAVVTLVPVSTGPINDLGYHSLCPFAPYSSLALLVPAGLALLLRYYLKAQKS
jgi:hypothetical protein